MANIFKKFEGNLNGKRVTFIATASNVEKVVFYVEAGKKELEKFGMVADVLDISTSTLVKK